jgi:hypothetical protein
MASSSSISTFVYLKPTRWWGLLPCGDRVVQLDTYGLDRLRQTNGLVTQSLTVQWHFGALRPFRTLSTSCGRYDDAHRVGCECRDLAAVVKWVEHRTHEPNTGRERGRAAPDRHLVADSTPRDRRALAERRAV